jgi:hypothetical protein
MTTHPANKKLDLGKRTQGIDSAAIQNTSADVKFLQNLILKMGVMTKHTSPKIHCHLKTSPVESLNLMSKQYLSQQRTRSQARRNLRSVLKWSHDAHDNQQTRRLPLYLMTVILQLRKFKVPKLDFQRKQYGLFHSGHLDQLSKKKSLCGSGHAGIV